MQGDQIGVRLPDWAHWFGTDQAAIPNVCVLLALIHHIIAYRLRLNMALMIIATIEKRMNMMMPVPI